MVQKGDTGENIVVVIRLAGEVGIEALEGNLARLSDYDAVLVVALGPARRGRAALLFDRGVSEEGGKGNGMRKKNKNKKNKNKKRKKKGKKKGK